MSREVLKSRAVHLTTVGLATFALSGCNVFKQEEKGVPGCSAEHVMRHHPLKNPDHSAAKLLSGITLLRARLGDEDLLSVSLAERSDYAYPIDAIYNKKSNNFYDLSDSKVDEPEEIFCHGADENQLYLSPEAFAVKGALKSIGKDVDRIKVE